jgi:hypothetical protein
MYLCRRASCLGYGRVQYYYGRYFRIYSRKGFHALVMGVLNIFMGVILEYIEVGGGVLHALVMGGLNIFMGGILEYIYVRGFTPWLWES